MTDITPDVTVKFDEKQRKELMQKIEEMSEKPLFYTSDGRTFHDPVKADEHQQELWKKDSYTERQYKCILHNLQMILDITAEHLENKDLELLYTLANDSMCRLEGVIHYPEEE